MRRSSKASAPRLAMDRLEDRITPVWNATPPLTISGVGFPTAVTLDPSGDAIGQSEIALNEVDWYEVTLPAGTSSFAASTPSSILDTVIGIYDSQGQRVAFNDNATLNLQDSRVTATLPAGTYFFGITNKFGSPGGSYTWSIDGPNPDDTYEENDTQAEAFNLGTSASPRTISGLVMNDAADWFRFTTIGTSNSAHTVSISFNNAQGDLDLDLVDGNGTVLASSVGTGNTETVSLSGLPAGPYWIHVYGFGGALNPGYTMTINPPGLPPPPPAPPPPPIPAPNPGFQITLNMNGFTTGQEAIFQQAVNRWSQVITADLPDIVYNGVLIDDLLIDADAVPIDGVNGILGAAAADEFRPVSNLPYHGFMIFDTADLAALEASGELIHVIIHEMGHVLGINSTQWQQRGLLTGYPGPDPLYTGASAIAQYNSYFGTKGGGVPVEGMFGPGTAGSHWRESLFDNEIMTGFLNSGSNPMSRVTIGALADLGYQVNFAAADPWVPSVSPLPPASSDPIGPVPIRSYSEGSYVTMIRDAVGSPPPASSVLAKIAGTAYIDMNGDGVRQGNDPVLSGRTVYLDLDNNKIHNGNEPIRTTDAAGRYDFGQLDSGNYTVREDVLAINALTGSAAGGIPVVLAGTDQSNVDIGHRMIASIFPTRVTTNLFSTTFPNSNTAYVYNVFRATLNRDPSASEVAYHVNALNSGYNRIDYATSIYNRDESLHYQVDKIYQTMVKRPADAAGLAFWSGHIRNGMQPEWLVVQLAAAGEYTAAHPTNTSFIHGLFNDILGRTANSADIAFWNNFLSTRSRHDMAFALAYSSETYTKAVQDVFVQYLHRPASQADINHWVNLLVTRKLTVARMTTLLIASGEFASKATNATG